MMEQNCQILLDSHLDVKQVGAYLKSDQSIGLLEEFDNFSTSDCFQAHFLLAPVQLSKL